jgi:DNA-binding NtrC family response regulator
MIEGDQSKEAELHIKFKKHCIRGEWFKPDREIIDYIFKNQKHDSLDVTQGINLPEIMESIERQYIEQALDLTNWYQPKAAKLLGISFRSIRYKIDKLKIDKY